jgi:hypothetical protein
MRVAVILENAPDCELHREVVEVPDTADTDAESQAIAEAVAGMTLAVGDTIKIREVL